MKKYTLFLFVFTLFVTLLGFNANSASAANCAFGDLFNTATGQPCSNTTTVTGCLSGYLFSPITGQSCSGANLGVGSQQFGSAGPLTMNQFNSLYKNYFVVGSRGEDVRALQQFLKDQGYYPGRVDGIYGAISARAVKDFKDDNVLYFSSTNSQTPATSNFSCNPTNVPLDVICGAYGLSVNSTYSIDFGDGTNSGPLTLIPPARAFGPDGPNNKMIDNPSHTYTSPGNYTISFYKNSTKIGSMNVTAVSPGTVSIGSSINITSLSPSSGPVCTSVTITGTGFAATGNTVSFGYSQIDNISSSNGGTKITFTVPDPAFMKPCRACAVGVGVPVTLYVNVSNLISGLNVNNSLPFYVTGSASSQIPVIDYVGSKDTVSGLNGYIISGSNHNDINGHNILSVNRAFLRTSISDASKIYNLPYTINNSDEGMSFTVPNTVPLGSYYLFLGSSAGISLPFPVTVVAGN